MYVPSYVFWILLIVLFIMVAGTMIYEIFVLTKLEGGSTNPMFIHTVAAITLSSFALVALIFVFVAYTVESYSRGNWLKSLVDGTQAKYERSVQKASEARASLLATQQRIKDLASIALHPEQKQRELVQLKQQEEYAKKALIESENERLAAKKEAEVRQTAAKLPAPILELPAPLDPSLLSQTSSASDLSSFLPPIPAN